CRSVYIFRHAYQLSLAGAYESALLLLERIAPEKKIWVRCPKTLFHLLRADILTNAETYRSAEVELTLAEKAGAKGEQIAIAKSKILRLEQAEGSYDKARDELKSAEDRFGETAVLSLEKGLLLLEEHKDLWEAKR